MALQIVTGHIYENKKSLLINKLLQIKAQDPQASVYYLVPEHIKFDMEKFVLQEIQKQQQTKHSAMIDLQVVSFSRLAWFLLRQQNQHQLNLSQIGLTMVIKQVLDRHKKSLVVYQGQEHHLGFVEKLRSLFEELYQGNITPDTLTASDTSEWSWQAGIINIEEQRLYELRLLYTDFCQIIEEQSLANYQSFENLSHYLATIESLPHHYIVIDHHYFFNAQQYQLIIDLAQKFNTVWITLPLTHHEAIADEWQPLTQVAQQTYQKLRHLSQLFDFAILPDWDIHQTHFNYQSAMIELAQRFKQQLTQLNAPVSCQQSAYHVIWQFDTPQSELRHLSNQIHYLVSKEGYRYQDILVLTRDMDYYQQMLAPYFEMNDIPYFYDHETTMAQHPLVLWLDAFCNLKLYHWRYQDLMIVLKSELLIPSWLNDDMIEARYQKMILENILIANGYFGYRFYSTNIQWEFQDSEQPYINSTGEKTTLTLGALVAQWRTWLIEMIYDPLQQWQDVTGKQASEWLYNILINVGIKNQLMIQRDKAIEKGNIELSRKLEQVWQVLMDTLDEFYLLYGVKDISFNLFRELLIAGLSQATYHIIPPTMDQVMITSMESPRVKPAKVCFVLGLDDTALPKSYVADSLLTEENRDVIKKRLLAHQTLLNSAEIRNQLEPLIAYQVLLNAAEKLYLLYASNVNGQTRNLSHYFTPLVKDGLIALQQFDIHNFTSKNLHTNQIGKVKMQLSPLLYRLRQSYQLGQALSDEQYAAIAQVLGTQADWFKLIQRMFTFHALPQNIRPETAVQLFGKNLYASVSKIEQFYYDPFSHYLIHGLRLKEREQYQINAAKTGDYFHSVLDILMQEIIKNGHNLCDLDNSKLQYYLASSIQSTNEDWKFNLFDSHPRMRVIRAQLDQQLWQFVQFSREQQRKVALQTIHTEAIFNGNQDNRLKGFVYPLKNGGNLYLTGKIDRIDQAIGQNKLQIIDYKSGNKQFNLADAYYGHDLQILTYLKVALNHYPDLEALGAFYQPLIQGYQSVNSEVLAAVKNDTVIDYQLDNNLLHGFVSITPDELAQIEPEFEKTGKSSIYPVKCKKYGTYRASSAYIDTESLDLLLRMIEERFIQAGEQIHQGIITLQPYKDYPYTQSLQPEFRVISGFDATEHYHLYRHKHLTAKEIIQRLQEEVSTDD